MQKYKITTIIISKNLQNYIELFKEQIELRPDFDDSDVFLNGENNVVIETNVDGYSKDDVEKITTEILWELTSTMFPNKGNLDIVIQSVEKVK